MRLAVLTTRTIHHAWFLRELELRLPRALVLEEAPAPSAPFEVAHPFETERDRHELGRWFAGEAEYAWPTGAERFASLNEPAAAARLEAYRPDMAIVFGTRRLAPELLRAAPLILNLHGGDPERYRGLDTHLWAVYHRDRTGLVTALHKVDAGLDTGDIVDMRPIPLRAGMRLHELRAANTELCLDMVLDAAKALGGSGTIAARPQRQRGRYYSHMPACLKDICVTAFERMLEPA